MRVLLITQYFHPENFKSNDIAFELAKRGHHVDTLVGIPNYPQGKYPKGYGVFSKRKEKIEGVNVYRVFQTPRGSKASSIGLALNYLTFAVNASLWILFFFIFKKRYDACIVFQVSPVTQVIPAVILKKIRKTPVYTWVLDVWPDSFVSSLPQGKAKSLVKAVTSLSEWAYKNSTKLMVTSPGMKPLLCRKRDYSDKIILFHNWCDDILAMPVNEEVSFGDKFIVMMAGSINDGIGIPYLLPVIENLQDEANLLFAFVGGGPMEQEFRNLVEEKKLKNVKFTGQVPFTSIPSYYKQADAMLISLKKTDLPHLKATIPGRLQSYMSAGKPVLAMIDEGARDMITTADCGFCVPAGDSEGLEKLIREVISMDKETLNQKGRNGRAFFEKHFIKEQSINILEDIIK